MARTNCEICCGREIAAYEARQELDCELAGFEREGLLRFYELASSVGALERVPELATCE